MNGAIKKLGLALILSAATGLAHAAECTEDLVASGEKVFRACKACHAVDDGKNGVGPHLFGVIGRDIASIDGFKYSKAMKAYGEENGVWTPELFGAYIEAPRKVVKGTRMAYPGLRNEDKRAQLLCYLEANG